MIFAPTPSQTVGPYFAIGLPFDGGQFVVPADIPGAIRIRGTVYDSAGDVIPDHLIETWQADSEGQFADAYGYGGRSQLSGFRGFARVGAEIGDGSFEIVTVKPGRVPDPSGALQAPHIDMSLFARGMLNRVVTRIYFADEPDANAEDPLLKRVPVVRCQTLLAQPTADGYTFDVHLSGPGETVFLAI
jgi:protocatechuate 3,4-dioxygenase alpha subunit